MKRTDLAKIFYHFNTDRAKLDEVGTYVAKTISESFSLLFAIHPLECKNILQQLNAHLTPEVVEQQIKIIEDGKAAYLKAQVTSLEAGPHLVFDDETTT